MSNLKNTMLPLITVMLTVTSLQAQEKPNVVVIIVDDLGYADMSFLPQAPADVKRYKTPGFDRLAATGTYFENAYATSPICSPSRAGILTGSYQQRWGNYWYGDGDLPNNKVILPAMLSSNGYATAKYGKTHLSGWEKKVPTMHGFDEYLGFMHHTWDYIRLSEKDVDAYKKKKGFKNFGCQVIGPLVKVEGQGNEELVPVSYENSFTTDIFTDEAIRFIKRDKGDKPFYLHLSYNAVHMPTYVVEETWAKKVGARYVPWDRNAAKWEFPYWDPAQEPHKKFHNKWGHMGEYDSEGRRCYLANLFALDYGISRLLDALEKSAQRENTMIIFISDNGGTVNTYSNNAPLRGSKYMLGEGGIRVPMIISMPGTLPQNVVNDSAMVSGMDIMPTVAELAGIPAPADIDGMSMLPVLKQEKKQHHEWIAWAKNENSWVLRRGKWKLTNNAGWGHKGFTIGENSEVLPGKRMSYPGGINLFNLETDIGETTNVADQNPEVVQKMLALHKEWASRLIPRLMKKKKKK